MVRAIGAIAAIVFAALFVIVLVQALNARDLVVPTNAVIGGGKADPVSETAADYQKLAERLQLQRWRGEAGPSPEADPNALRVQVRYQPEESPYDRVVDWLGRSGERDELLQPRRFIQGQTWVAANPVVDVLAQPQGRDWRAFRNSWPIYGGGLFIFGVCALLAAFLAYRGRIRIREGESGESVPRFGIVERVNHWMTAVSFILLALTGLITLYGRSLLRPILGPDTFADLALGSAWLHIALLVPFALGLIIMFLVWIRHNLPSRLDWEWLKRGGGLGSDHSLNPPARKFNAGQKLVFWAVILGGALLVASGLTMMFPFLWAGYDGMALGQSIHVITAMLMIGLILGHIYIGRIGMEGAFPAIWTGRVDRNWAKEHHSLWYEDLLQRGAVSPRPATEERSAAPRGGLASRA